MATKSIFYRITMNLVVILSMNMMTLKFWKTVTKAKISLHELCKRVYYLYKISNNNFKTNDVKKRSQF